MNIINSYYNFIDLSDGVNIEKRNDLRLAMSSWVNVVFLCHLITCMVIMVINISFQGDELSFDEGDTLYILDMSNTDWWKAKCGNNTGLIPSNYGEQKNYKFLWIFRCKIFV